MKDIEFLKPQKRTRLVLVLSIFFALLLGAELLEKKNLREIDEDFSSLYRDRLIPAAQMYEISELMHQKQIIFELLDEGQTKVPAGLYAEIHDENTQIQDILTDFEQTHLVEEEVAYLDSFKEDLQVYLKTEADILRLLKDGDFEAAQFHILNGRYLFREVNANLHNLVEIQPRVGRELMDHYHSSYGSSSMLYYFKIALTLIVGFLVVRILSFSEVINPPARKFELKKV